MTEHGKNCDAGQSYLNTQMKLGQEFLAFSRLTDVTPFRQARALHFRLDPWFRMNRILTGYA
jgi:hypothetical protein